MLSRNLESVSFSGQSVVCVVPLGSSFRKQRESMFVSSFHSRMWDPSKTVLYRQPWSQCPQRVLQTLTYIFCCLYISAVRFIILYNLCIRRRGVFSCYLNLYYFHGVHSIPSSGGTILTWSDWLLILRFLFPVFQYCNQCFSEHLLYIYVSEFVW